MGYGSAVAAWACVAVMTVGVIVAASVHQRLRARDRGGHRVRRRGPRRGRRAQGHRLRQGQGETTAH
ncbi:hypothetical protein QJS66_02125 [Kocuria rhizophila]|nr:hypothetical protein QJS66_02125 [Kocuria rhizophila]